MEKKKVLHKPKFKFNNDLLNQQLLPLRRANARRYEPLDAFNEDCKTLTELLIQFNVPNISWTEIEDEELYLSIGWYRNKIVWCEEAQLTQLKDSADQTLLEASAEIRMFFRNNDALETLMLAAIWTLNGEREPDEVPTNNETENELRTAASEE